VGTEILWCIRNNANEVVGLDVGQRDLKPLQSALELLGIQTSTKYSFIQKSINEALDLDRKFDLILSNNVFEHIFDIQRALFVCSQLVKPANESRIAIFTDPLYYNTVYLRLGRI
jgi:2-polyprenyl-3-methyl-5-hydroxy-6-metoxy-1,4-benzoquinol methylase